MLDARGPRAEQFSVPAPFLSLLPPGHRPEARSKRQMERRHVTCLFSVKKQTELDSCSKKKVRPWLPALGGADRRCPSPLPALMRRRRRNGGPFARLVPGRRVRCALERTPGTPSRRAGACLAQKR